MKKYVSGLLTGIIITLSVSGYTLPSLTAYYNTDIKLRVDGEYIDVIPITAVEEGQANGFNLLPVRALGEALGYEVSFDPQTKVIDLDKQTIEDVAKNAESCVLIRSGNEERLLMGGSGVVVGDYIITNKHVLEGYTRYTVEYNDSTKQYEAERVYIDTNLDIGILKSPKKVKGVTLGDSDKVRVGEEVVIIGSPRELKNTVSKGIVSGLREYEWVKYIQTNAKASPGNSGSGVFDLNGNVIGIIKGSYIDEDINAAIAINQIKPILDTLN